MATPTPQPYPDSYPDPYPDLQVRLMQGDVAALLAGPTPTLTHTLKTSLLTLTLTVAYPIMLLGHAPPLYTALYPFATCALTLVVPRLPTLSCHLRPDPGPNPHLFVSLLSPFYFISKHYLCQHRPSTWL